MLNVPEVEPDGSTPFLNAVSGLLLDLEALRLLLLPTLCAVSSSAFFATDEPVPLSVGVRADDLSSLPVSSGISCRLCGAALVRSRAVPRLLPGVRCALSRDSLALPVGEPLLNATSSFFTGDFFVLLRRLSWSLPPFGLVSTLPLRGVDDLELGLSELCPLLSRWLILLPLLALRSEELPPTSSGGGVDIPVGALGVVGIAVRE